MGLDVVDRIEDESAAGGEIADPPPHFARTSAGVPRMRTDCVSQPPPQKERFLPYFFFSFAESMPSAETCTGLMMSTPISIRSGRKYVRRPAGMVEDLRLGPSLDRRDDLRPAGLDHPPIDGGRNQGAVLAGQIVGGEMDVDQVADLVEIAVSGR